MSEIKNEQVETKDEETKEVTVFDKVKETAGHVWTKAKPVVKAVGIGILTGAAILGVAGAISSKLEAGDEIESDEETDEGDDVPFETDSVDEAA